MSLDNSYYLNPLGDLKELPINNKVNKLKKNDKVINAQLEDSKNKNKGHNHLFYIWSVVAAIFILILLVLLRNIN